jgi:hypothetical protein
MANTIEPQMAKPLSLVLASLIGVAFLGAVSVSPSIPVGPAQVGPLETITLERTPCGGTCRPYSVQIDADDTLLVADGFSVPAVQTQKVISAQDFAFLDAELNRAHFDTLARRYNHGVPGCRSFDSSSLIISVRRAGIVEQMVYDPVCGASTFNPFKADDAPITSLANVIDRIAGVDRRTLTAF